MPNPDLGIEYNPLLLSMGLVEYNYEFEDFKLETIKRKIIGNRLNNQNNDSKLLDYFHVLNDNIYKETQNRKHDIFVEMIKLNINTTFYGNFSGCKVSLTKDTYTYYIEDDFFVVFNLMDDGKIQLDNVSKNNEEEQRCYVFGELKEFYHFISNIKENLEIDDKVLKMALI
jgi:hypothetical protein